MRFRLWGTRGSIPSPARAEEIEAKIHAALSAAAEAAVDLSNTAARRAFIASLPYDIRGTAGGDTSCLEVRSAGNLLIFDCGSGLRRLGQDLMKQEFGRGQGLAHIFITHTHWDHMMGWPFFGPVYVPGNKLYIYGVHPDLEERFRLQQTAPSMFPKPFDFLAADIRFMPFPEGETIDIGPTRVRNIKHYHLGDSYGYRVEDDDGALVFATDNEYKTLAPTATEHYVEFFRNADALIFDAMFSWTHSYLFEDWGHSSAVAGVDLATRAGVRRLLLFHHNPSSTDEEIWSLRKYAEDYLKQHPERTPCEIIVAYDGLEMEIWGEATLEARAEQRSDGVVVHLVGRLVDETAPTALAAIEEAVPDGYEHPIAVNLRQITHLDRDGLAALFAARRRWHLLVLCGLSTDVSRTFEQAGAIEYFAVFDTPDDALSSVKGSTDLRPEQVLGNKYRIVERLERGRLGDIYLAVDQVARSRVAVHTLCPSLGPAPAEAIMGAAQRSSGLRHPLIAEVLGAGQDGHTKYVVTEYTPGRSIRQQLSMPQAEDMGSPEALRVATTDRTQVPMPIAQAVRIVTQIAQALEYAHARNSVHGALRPETIILLDDGTIKVTDFSIGRPESDKPLSELPAHVVPIDYTAPEQLHGLGSTASSDLYSLGTIFYEMLTGTSPFGTVDDDEDMISLQLRQPPVPPRRRNPRISRSLEHLVLNMLEKSPQQRTSGASVVLQMLANLDPSHQQKVLLGRDSARQKLRHHLQRVAQGQSGMLVVAGQRGIGKSQLVLSIADERVSDQPFLILRGEMFLCEDSRSYKLFVQSLRPALHGLPAHQLSTLLNDLGDLAHPLTALIPDLQPTLTAFSSTIAGPEVMEEAICETFRLLTNSGPVVLIMDSLQWIDATSLRVLDHLARRRIPRLLMIALYRSEEIDLGHPLRRVLDGLDSWIDEQLFLPALGPIEVHHLASTINNQIPPDFGLWLYGETEGNPLHIEQLIQAYLEGPSETRLPFERSMATSLEDVILRRLERLPDGTLYTLRQAAVLGHMFQFSALRAALDQPEQSVLADLDFALQSRLITGDLREDRYRFRHPLIREVIYTEMLGGVRKRYHGRAARVLEPKGTPGLLDEIIELVAHHFLCAGEYEKAVAYLARATRRARQLGAHETALDYVQQALAVVEELSQTATTDREREQRDKQRRDLLTARERLEASLTA